MADPNVDLFLQQVDHAARDADFTSNCLNYTAIFVTVAIAAVSFVATLAAATDRWSKTKRAVLAGLPGFLAAVLAGVLTPRVDWHRKKELGLTALANAVRYEGLSLQEGSKRRSELEQDMEGWWQEARNSRCDSSVVPHSGDKQR